MHNRLAVGLPWEHLRQQLRWLAVASKGQTAAPATPGSSWQPSWHASVPAAKPARSRRCLWCSERSWEPSSKRNKHHQAFFSCNCGSGMSNRNFPLFCGFHPIAPQLLMLAKESLTWIRDLGLLPGWSFSVHTGYKEAPAHQPGLIGTQPLTFPTIIWKINPKSRVSHRCEEF